ncbi:hypothetical protein MGSAQ_000505 [marine sediment metagenome]|uniref:Uncharacterized protein n=1 Tax=marine sediment metagenome TaxID=412755 RepID=A0A1B6NX50_9ZZZZ
MINRVSGSTQVVLAPWALVYRLQWVCSLRTQVQPLW